MILFCYLKLFGLQTQLVNLCTAASRMELNVNMNKSIIVAFQKRGLFGFSGEVGL